MTTDPSVAPVPLTPRERRERNRREMTEAILAAARAVMREHGVAALNLNEVARRVRLRPQSLAEYFPTKADLYDALHVQAITLFRDGDERAYRENQPGWEQIEAWFVNRIALANENPDLYHLTFDAPVPDYIVAERTLERSREVLAGSRRMVASAVKAGAMEPGMPVDRATDLLLSVRHGLIAERIGKRPFLPEQSERFSGLLPDMITILKVAWAPASAQPRTARNDGDVRRDAMND